MDKKIKPRRGDAFDPMRGKPCRSGQGQERGRQSRPGGLDWF
jgi:hypothetical protein